MVYGNGVYHSNRGKQGHQLTTNMCRYRERLLAKEAMILYCKGKVTTEGRARPGAPARHPYFICSVIDTCNYSLGKWYSVPASFCLSQWRRESQADMGRVHSHFVNVWGKSIKLYSQNGTGNHLLLFKANQGKDKSKVVCISPGHCILNWMTTFNSVLCSNSKRSVLVTLRGANRHSEYSVLVECFCTCSVSGCVCRCVCVCMHVHVC